MDGIVDLSPYVMKSDEHCVGSGGFGDVYQGVMEERSSDSKTERTVAIKVIRPSMAHVDSLPKAIKRLKREIAVWQGLDHINVVPFLGVSYTFGRMPALISLWMENGRLDGYLMTHPDADRCSIAQGLASGLQYLHSRAPKITHGDVKAGNTLVDKDGNPRLCDFGLSRMLSDDSLWVTTTANSRGSVRWMAPELLDGREILPTPESDVYAFAMTILEILTGKIPYHNHRMDGAVLVAVTIRKELPIPPTDMDISHVWQVDLEELWDWLTHCWDHDPGRRPSSAAAEEFFRPGREVRMLSAVSIPAVIPSKPFKGHKDMVLSVAFSPDGKRIASGSGDCTVRVWNAETGEMVLTPIMGHLGSVHSVAFSPDGKCIASACKDGTVRVWDAKTGKLVSGPLKGHEACVLSIAYSSDGKRIASGSQDSTVRMWNAETGQAVLGPFIGHEGPVYSVAFSPDDKWIASGSMDHSVRHWNAMTGVAVSEPFEGHTDGICSVAYSSDGERIASGSYDKTVRVWDAESGRLVSTPFIHTGDVHAIAFSPDGKRIVSGSADNTVRVWDAVKGTLLLPPFEGHTDWVHSVAFSTDGKRIVSGSLDHTLRVWNARVGVDIYTEDM